MRVLVTGAAGMIGTKLVERLRAEPTIGSSPVDHLDLFDVVEPPTEGRDESPLVGDLSVEGVAAELVERRPDLIFHLAGGDGGMRQMLEQFGPALEWPWTKLVAPPLTPRLADRMVEGTQEQAGDRTVAELETLRDNALIAIMEALQEYQVGAGEVLARRRRRTETDDG